MLHANVQILAHREIVFLLCIQLKPTYLST